MQEEDSHCRQAADQTKGIEQANGCHDAIRADVIHVRVNRYTLGEVGECRPEQERRHEGTDGDHPVEAIAPGRVGVFRAIFEGDTANDQANQQQEQRQIKAAEHGRVPVRERCKGRTAGREQPDFVAIPDRADGIDDGAAFFVFLTEDGNEHSHAEVEAFEEVETDP